MTQKTAASREKCRQLVIEGSRMKMIFLLEIAGLAEAVNNLKYSNTLIVHIAATELL